MSAGLVDTTRTWVTRPAEREDASVIARLWERRFDPFDDISEDTVMPWLPGSEVYDVNQAWVAESGTGDIVGVGLASLPSKEELQRLMHLSSSELDALASGRDGYFYLLAVDEAWTGRGIGTALFRDRLNWFREERVRAAFGLSWQRRGDAATSEPIFERFGFEEIGVKPDLYWEDERTCPDCGGRCECPAAVYGRRLR